jgi:hypothetical protein
VRLEGLSQLKISNDFIRNRTRDRPACGIAIFYLFHTHGRIDAANGGLRRVTNTPKNTKRGKLNDIK